MMSPNPESFVVDKINRLEHDWAVQDEIIDWQLNQGRSTGEYYNQTGNERSSDPNGQYFLGSFLGLDIYSHTGGCGMFGMFQFPTDEAENTPSLEIPDGFVDLGYISDDGITMMDHSWAPTIIFTNEDYNPNSCGRCGCPSGAHREHDCLNDDDFP